MRTALTRNWWMLAVRGGLAVLFGLAAMVWPGITLGELVVLFGAYAFVDGLFAIASAIRAAERPRQGWPLLAEGAMSSALGILAWVSPFAPLLLPYLIATWAVITGVLEIVGAVSLRGEFTSSWLLGISGASSVLLGMLVMTLPGAGAIEVVRMIGVYALIFGVLLVAAGFRLRARGQLRLSEVS